MGGANGAAHRFDDVEMHQPGNILACSSGGTRLDGDPSGGMSVRHESLVTFFSCTPKTISDGTSYPAMLIIADVIAARPSRSNATYVYESVTPPASFHAHRNGLSSDWCMVTRPSILMPAASKARIEPTKASP